MNLWELPGEAVLGGRRFPIRTDFRQALKALAVLGDEGRPAVYRWYLALALIFQEPVPEELVPEAAEFLRGYLTCGQEARPGPRLFDWEQDAAAILADINRTAGREIRQEHMHWWTFLSLFQGIGEGQLSFLVGIREKLRRGEKLTQGEQEFYRRHPERVRLEAASDPEKDRLNALLG